MAASTVPTDYLTGYAYLATGASAPANGVFIPLTTLVNVDASEAHASTGDIRKIIAAFLEAFNTKYALQTEKPVKLSISSTRTPSYQGTALVIQDRYTISVTRDGTIGDVSAE
jgi:hypothetical protein